MDCLIYIELSLHIVISRFRVIARAAIPDTGLVFKRRPATQAIAYVQLEIHSFQHLISDLFYLGYLLIWVHFKFSVLLQMQHNLNISNINRPILAQPVSRSVLSNQPKLLHVEFETNPLDKKSDYRVKVISQSLEIKYNAVSLQFSPSRKTNIICVSLANN